MSIPQALNCNDSINQPYPGLNVVSIVIDSLTGINVKENLPVRTIMVTGALFEDLNLPVGHL
jgi:hypothetical protein